ncbi:hypothetical protein O6H91_18G080300 [Diphasiastrum complanatum]|uniref:Uncharacterized protein n=1 Tax=Diphasiastrum complanatum TaxID=34168 RepID=A0ACC2B326_DIPCM|nr:hypothetical protein O6H91_18G080300 [Diphasiastrum complanatum]
MISKHPTTMACKVYLQANLGSFNNMDPSWARPTANNGMYIGTTMQSVSDSGHTATSSSLRSYIQKKKSERSPSFLRSRLTRSIMWSYQKQCLVDKLGFLCHPLPSERCSSKVPKFKSLVCCHLVPQEQSKSYQSCTVSTLWQTLKPTISYLSAAQLNIVQNALKLACEAHDGQKRKSGEPYITHPVEVARILGQIEMDWETIAAGLLHDTVEDTTLVTFEKIEELFGPVVRRIVEGETKVSKLGKLNCSQSEAVGRDVKADDLRQMFLAMTEEVRVIIVKLADRLHNMRTLSYMPLHKQHQIARETLQVFAPLARLLGMYRIKSELEDLSFMYAHPVEYADLKKRVEEVFKEQEEMILEAKKSLTWKISRDQFLNYVTLDVDVVTVCKELYSIYKKLKEINYTADEIGDVAQVRIILKMKPDSAINDLCSVQQVCYHVLGLVHALWPPVPQTLKDYIATPKPNGYQSLHTKVIPFGSNTLFPLELQIRTVEMHKLAEWGIAAYYSGKLASNTAMVTANPFSSNNFLPVNGAASGVSKGVNFHLSGGSSNGLNYTNLARRVSWLNSIREWQEEFVGNMTSREFVDTITGDLLGSRVFVFTPKGEIKNLPKGATVIDYAYQIHTDVGNNMVAAKVNGNLVSPNHTLANAEVVEILTYDGVSHKKVFDRHKQWLQFAKTRSARHKLTKFLKEQAAMSAAEITADAVRNFVSDLEELEDDSEDGESELDDNIASEEQLSENSPMTLLSSIKYFHELNSDLYRDLRIPNSLDSEHQLCQNTDNVDGFPRAINGKYIKITENRNDYASCTVKKGAFGTAYERYDAVSVYEEARAGIEAWQTSRILVWHKSDGKSIQWFRVCCLDRRSMLADVTSILGAAGIFICACMAETDRKKGLAVMLFHIEGSMENINNACFHMDSVDGILSWSVGCSLQKQ